MLCIGVPRAEGQPTSPCLYSLLGRASHSTSTVPHLWQPRPARAVGQGNYIVWCLLLQGQGQSEAVLSFPSKPLCSLHRYKAVWLIFFILGLGTLLPWNFFMTAREVRASLLLLSMTIIVPCCVSAPWYRCGSMAQRAEDHSMCELGVTSGTERAGGMGMGLDKE